MDSLDQVNQGFIIGNSIAIALLLLLSFFFSGSETAVTTIKPYQWESHRGHKEFIKKDKIVFKILKDYSITLGALLIGNTICNIVAPSLVTLLVTELLNSTAVGLSTGILTFFVLLFCEYLPKSLARKHSIGWLNIFYFPIYFFWIIFWPFCILFNYIFEKKKNATASERDLNFLIKTVQNEGVLEQDEATLVKKAMSFDDTKVKDIVQVNHEVVFVYEDDDIEYVIEKFINSNFSRIPVVQRSTNKVLGFVLSKEIFKNFYLNRNKPNDFLKIKKFTKKIYCVTSEMMLDDVMRIIQRTNTHILAVVDNLENKKMIGIITTEMLLEQLVGQIYDEKDGIKKIQLINDFTWIVDPDVNANYFMEKYFSLKISNKDLTMERYLQKLFRTKELTLNKSFENNLLKVLILTYGDERKISYEIIKK